VSTARRLRRHLQDLERARVALATAKERREDPWRVSELQLRYDRLNERVLDVELAPDLAYPAPRTRAPYPPVKDPK